MIGGGQLGRMSAFAAAELGYKVHVFCPQENAPALQFCTASTIADYTDEKALLAFAKAVDVVTFEFENIPYEAVEFLSRHVEVRPSARVLYIAQHRLREKDFVREIGVETAPYRAVRSGEELASAFASLGGGKALLKTTQMGYDGKGQYVLKEGDDLKAIWLKSGMKEGILEGFVDFEKEISVVIARGLDTETAAFTPAENTHVNGILDTSTVPASVSDEVRIEAKAIAHKIADALNLTGILAVEFFVTKEGRLLVNELAPRPHNSGHWTQDGCLTSQFEQFIRAICGLPLGSIRRHSDVRMKNLLGADVNDWEKYLVQNAEAKLHLYGKDVAKEGRKMGHVNFVTPMPLGAQQVDPKVVQLHKK
jgi:5-(carboxyamino)imidazole ribonucleotide synthase